MAKDKPTDEQVDQQFALVVRDAEAQTDSASLNLQLETEDALALFRTGCKRYAKEKIAACQARHRELQSELADALQEARDLNVEVVDAQVSEQSDALVEAFAVCGHKIKVVVGHPQVPGVKAQKLNASLCCMVGRDQHPLATVTVAVKVSKEQRALAKKIEKLSAQSKAATDEQLLWKRKIASIGELVEEKRGELAAIKLRDMPDGDMYLDALTGNIMGAMDQLLLT